MNNDNTGEILINKAEVENAEHILCDNCFEPVVFLLRDKDHEFSVGLTTLLECLAFAIRNGDLPKLPASWCSDVSNAFRIRLGDDVSYYDAETFKKRFPRL